MTGTVLRRLSASVGAATAIAASIVIGGSAAQAVASPHIAVQDVGTASHRTWACTVPSGYTYTSSRQGSDCAASPGASPYEYRLARV
ncbi:MAG: hypothetical protein ABIQ18_42325 [Umezawaea sp.]